MQGPTDFLGLQAAFAAYRKAHVGETKSPLPGLEAFTDDQLFFISFARVWCANETSTNGAASELFNVHSASSSRVIGTLQNFAPFQVNDWEIS